MVREMETLIEQTPENEEWIKNELISQPLFRVSNKNPEAMAKLSEHYSECAQKIPQLLQGTNESLAQLLQSQFRPTLQKPL